MGKTWSVADTLNSSAHNKGTFLHSACGGFPFVFYLQLCPPSPKGQGSVFQSLHCNISFFPLCYSHGLVSANSNSIVMAILKGNCSLSLLSPVFLALPWSPQFTLREAIRAFRELNGQAMCSTCCPGENTQGGICLGFPEGYFFQLATVAVCPFCLFPFFLFFFHFSPEITFTITIRICHQLQTSANKSPCT